MLGKTLFTFAPGIVSRLRMVFLLISVLLAGVLAVGIFQSQALRHSADQLTETSVPVFVRAAETERSLKNLLLLLRRIDASSGLVDLAPLKARLADELSSLKTNTKQLSSSGPTSEYARKLTAALNNIDLGALAIIETKQEIIESEQKLTRGIESLEARRETLRVLLEELAYNVSVTAERDLDLADTPTATSLVQLKQSMNRSIALANTITTITFEAKGIFDTATALNNLRDVGQIEQYEASLRFKLRGIFVLIRQLPETTNRVELAEELSEVRDFVFDDDGFLSEAARLQRHREALEVHKANQITPVKTISDLAHDLTGIARAQVDVSGQNLSDTIQQLFLIQTLAMLASVGAICWAMVSIVEWQMNKRMARLTHAVLAIADGQTEYEVGVTGEDELATMATALEVFKTNAKELQRSNKELEKFAYAAAHDLRSPLRAVQDLAEWTLDDEDNDFSDDGRKNMALLLRRTFRLNQLLKDLLEYARAGKETDNFIEVSMKDIVEETTELLDGSSRFKISFAGTHDLAVTFATPFRQIVLNLINNGIKHHDLASGTIKVEARFENDKLVCAVTDDGPGIPPRYHERIFGLFQTLRPRDDIEGSGLGLAIIRKLLEYHDGTIKVISNPDQGRGSTFEFSLPGRPAQTSTINEAA